MKVNPLEGKRFGKLQVLMRVANRGERVAYLCQCDCGNRHTTTSGMLIAGTVNSCGCIRKSGLRRTHSMSRSREYGIWAGMHKRCVNPKCKSFKDCGGRGIYVCERWESFANFFADLGPSNGLTLERMDSNKEYSPENCRWADRKDQARNRNSSHLIEFNGETHCIATWAEKVGLKRDTLKRRIYLGWTIERALSEGVRS